MPTPKPRPPFKNPRAVHSIGELHQAELISHINHAIFRSNVPINKTFGNNGFQRHRLTQAFPIRYNRLNKTFGINNRNNITIKREPCNSCIVYSRSQDGWTLLEETNDSSRMLQSLVGLSHHLLVSMRKSIDNFILTDLYYRDLNVCEN